jgi:hypothetical protein
VGKALVLAGIAAILFGFGWHARGKWDAGEIAGYQKKLALIEATAKAEEDRNAENERQARAQLQKSDIKLRSAVAAADSAAQRAERLEATNRDLLRSIRLPTVARSVFNASVRIPATPAEPDARDDGKAGAPEADLNLDDVLRVSIENNANHLKCVAQVEAWQSFWPKVKQLCEGSSGQGEAATGD